MPSSNLSPCGISSWLTEIPRIWHTSSASTMSSLRAPDSMLETQDCGTPNFSASSDWVNPLMERQYRIALATSNLRFCKAYLSTRPPYISIFDYLKIGYFGNVWRYDIHVWSPASPVAEVGRKQAASCCSNRSVFPTNLRNLL